MNRPTGSVRSLAHWAIATTVVTMLAVTGASALDLAVTTTDDHLDFICDQSDCSLRDAVYSANLNPGADIITLPAGTYLLDLAGSDEDAGLTGDLDITSEVQIIGQGAGTTTISAEGLGDRVLHVNAPGAAVELVDLTVARGVFASGGDVTTFGGGILHDSGSLTLTGVTVSFNRATAGAGIHSGDTLSVQDGCRFKGNIAELEGGGLRLTGASATVSSSTIEGNEAGYQGGGIMIVQEHVTLENVTIASNTVRGTPSAGGGIAAVSISPSSTVNIGNSTLMNNSSVGLGGALALSGPGTVNLASVTIAGNHADQGVVLRSTSPLQMVNTAIWGYCQLVASFTSGGGNLEGPLNTCSLVPPYDQVGVADLKLSQLDDFGGPTSTAIPLPGSPLIDAASATFCPPQDQRGFPRSADTCDVGAVERQPVEPEPMLMDDFESGDTSAWSSAVGA